MKRENGLGWSGNGFAEGNEPARDAAPRFMKLVAASVSAAVTVVAQFNTSSRHRRPGMGQAAAREEGYGKE